MVSRTARRLLICLVLPACAAAAEAYDYQMRDLDGRVHRASDHRGKWLVINFWATWCPPCVHEMPELERFYQANRPRAQVRGVTFEDTPKEKIVEFVGELGVTYPIVGHGQDPQTGYGRVTVLPTTFVIDPDGLFHHRFEGAIMAHQIEAIIRPE